MKKKNICLIGPSNYFKSGLTTYNLNLLEILNNSPFFSVSAIFLNKFIPKSLFPGKNRNIDDYPLIIPSNVPYFNGIDWYLLPSLIKGLKFVSFNDKNDTKSFLIQWWTSSVLHIYLSFSYIIKFLNPESKIILEIHEVFDPLEQKIKPLGLYVKLFFPLLINKVDYIIFHSKQEVLDFSKRFDVPRTKIRLAKHILDPNTVTTPKPSLLDDNKIVILYFGLIREYKGVPLLIEAFSKVMNKIEPNLPKRIELHIVGEIWDEKQKIYSLVKNSKYKDNIHLKDKYIPDNEISIYFSQSNFLVLPYLRGTQSGVIHLGMNYNLPIITTDVGGFKESLNDYKSKIIIPANDVDLLENSILEMINKVISSNLKEERSVKENKKDINNDYVKIINKIVNEKFEAKTHIKIP